MVLKRRLVNLGNKSVFVFAVGNGRVEMFRPFVEGLVQNGLMVLFLGIRVVELAEVATAQQQGGE